MVFSAVALLLSSCTEVDDQLGADLIPEDQLMSVAKIETFNAVTTSTYYNDTIVGSNLGYLYLGREESEIYGLTSACFFTQFSPYYNFGDSSDDDDAPFGIDPVVDSLILTLPIYVASSGDSTVVQYFNIYNMIIDTLHYDSTYYANVDYTTFIGDNDPIASFSFAGTYIDDDFTVDLTDSGIGESLFDISGDIYESDTIFFERFKGLVFTQTGDEVGSIYTLLTSDMTMTLYYRNFDSSGNVADTCYYYFTFDDSSSTYNSTLNFFSHDYSNSQVVLDSETAQATTYVQGYAGVATLLTFQEDFIEELKSLYGPGTDYSSIAINKAELTIYTVGECAEENEYASSRLGMYEDYVSLVNIPDYYYYYEEVYSYTLAYGGYLESSLSQYTMDITAYFLDLVQGNEDAFYDVILGTTYSTQAQFQQVALSGSTSSKPPKLTVTYTLIK